MPHICLLIKKTQETSNYEISTLLFTHRAGDDIYCSLFGECHTLLWLTESWYLCFHRFGKFTKTKHWRTSQFFLKIHWSKTWSEWSGRIVLMYCGWFWNGNRKVPMETRRTVAGLTRGMLCRAGALNAGASQGGAEH